MDVNDDAGILDTRGVPATIASKLAPTGDLCQLLEVSPAGSFSLLRQCGREFQ
ncbi:hypothetical protein C8K63_11220 [Pseudomonas sp. GV085]|nr:hypothetical protein C8K63_11220 [Pseudomonas sp. GV085]